MMPCAMLRARSVLPVSTESIPTLASGMTSYLVHTDPFSPVISFWDMTKVGEQQENNRLQFLPGFGCSICHTAQPACLTDDGSNNLVDQGQGRDTWAQSSSGRAKELKTHHREMPSRSPMNEEQPHHCRAIAARAVAPSDRGTAPGQETHRYLKCHALNPFEGVPFTARIGIRFLHSGR